MGLFSKKDYVCEQCGKEFQARLTPISMLCDECYEERERQKEELEGPIQGYIKYRKKLDFTLPDYTPDEMRAIKAHRDGILKKYTLSEEERFLPNELEQAGNNFKCLSQEEVFCILHKIECCQVDTNFYGAAFSNYFYLPTFFDETIVEKSDIFAVCFTCATGWGDSNTIERLRCALFTNDPYIPVFPVEFCVDKGVFEFVKSKNGRKAAEDFFTNTLDNLTYPVCDGNELAKIIKGETEIKGNISKEMMLSQIGSLGAGMGLFAKKVSSYDDVSMKMIDMLNEAGYKRDLEIQRVLHLEDRVSGQFWMKAYQMYSK